MAVELYFSFLFEFMCGKCGRVSLLYTVVGRTTTYNNSLDDA